MCALFYYFTLLLGKQKRVRIMTTLAVSEHTHMLILTTKTNPFIVILLLIFSSQLSFNEVLFVDCVHSFYDSSHFVQMIIFC